MGRKVVRASLTELVAALGLAAAGPASAQPWTDPAGRLVLDLPAGWRADVPPCTDCTYVLAFNASNDCHFLARPRAATEAVLASRVRAVIREGHTINTDAWVSNAGAIPRL